MVRIVDTFTAPLARVPRRGCSIDRPPGACHRHLALAAAPLPIGLSPPSATGLTGADGFLEHQPLGFDASVLESTLDHVRRGLGDIASSLTNAGAQELWPWLLLAALFAVATAGLLLLDRRLLALRGQLTASASDVSRLLGTLSGLVSPTVAWFLATLLAQADTRAVEAALLGQQLAVMLLLYRAWLLLVDGLTAQVEAGPADDDASVAARAARARRVLLRPAPFILVAAAVERAVGALAFPSDAAALASFVFRTTVTVFAFSVFAGRRELLALLPGQGDERYLRFRRMLDRWFAGVVAASAVLLMLWILGFHRAASTLLLRSWAIVAVFVSGALVHRWLADTRSDSPMIRHPVLRVVVGPADWVVRLVFYSVATLAIVHLLGLQKPLTGLLAHPFLRVGDSGVSAWGVLKACGALLLAVVISRAARASLDAWLFPELRVPAATAFAIGTLAHYVIVGLGAVAALSASGLDLGGLAVFAGAAGLGIGFGLREIAAQFVSGFALMVGGTVGRGDLVTLGDRHTGRVTSMGLRRVIVTTSDNVEIIVPSTDLVTSPVVAWTRSSPWARLRVEVTVTYGTAIEATRNALLDLLRSVHPPEAPGEPDVWITNIGDDGITLQVLFWSDLSRLTPEESQASMRTRLVELLEQRGVRVAASRTRIEWAHGGDERPS
jgi:small-conductance mechanosensitive channel